MRLASFFCCVTLLVMGWGCKSEQLSEPEPVAKLTEVEPEVSEELPPPTPAPSPGELATTPPAPPETTYVVQRGDTLYSIARQFYGDGKLWTVIYEANRELIPSPRAMKVGTELRIPARALPLEQEQR